MTTIAIALALGLGFASPFAPAVIVLLEMFMDLGASVAFTSEPSSPTVMRRRPRNPAAHFLDRAELGSIAITGLALTVATLPAYLLVRANAGSAAGSAAAVAAGLSTHAAIAWSLRMNPRLDPRANPTFPVWALTAAATALLVTLTRLGRELGLGTLDLANLGIAAGTSLAGALVAVAGRRIFGLSARL